MTPGDLWAIRGGEHASDRPGAAAGDEDEVIRKAVGVWRDWTCFRNSTMKMFVCVYAFKLDQKMLKLTCFEKKHVSNAKLVQVFTEKSDVPAVSIMSSRVCACYVWGTGWSETVPQREKQIFGDVLFHVTVAFTFLHVSVTCSLPPYLLYCFVFLNNHTDPANVDALVLFITLVMWSYGEFMVLSLIDEGSASQSRPKG